jgi:ADP-heptose:LPS heptosyltransferase
MLSSARFIGEQARPVIGGELARRDRGAAAPPPARSTPCEPGEVTPPMTVENPLPSPPEASSILVIRLGALGDVVRTRFALPGLRALYPDARIDWLVEDRAAAGLEGVAGLDDVIRVPRARLSYREPLRGLMQLRALVRDLRARRYDLVVDFHSILKSAALARLAGAPLRVGYAPPFAREGSSRLYTHAARVSPTHLSRFERNAALIEYLGGEVPSEPPPLTLTDEIRPDLEAVPSGLVVMHPGTSESTRYKRWAPERYAEVAREIRRSLDLESVVTWGPVDAERRAAEAVVAGADGAARLAPPTHEIADLLALLRRGRLFVGSDSGPMHLASLAGLPVVVLFGPTDPLENEPFPGRPCRVVRVDVGCNPCRAGCPVLTCMAAIEVEGVVEAVRSLVAAGSRVD